MQAWLQSVGVKSCRKRLATALFAGTASLLTCSFAAAQNSAVQMPAAAVSSTNHHGLTAEEFSAQSRQVIARSPRRVRIYNSRTPGPNSVRICNAHYEYEYRQSGTVIVPRMQCYWSG